MEIDKKQIERISALAMINTNEDTKLSDDIKRLLEYFSSIQNADLSGIHPMVLPPQCILKKRTDKPGKTLDRVTLLKESPSIKDDYFLVPQIIGEKK